MKRNGMIPLTVLYIHMKVGTFLARKWGVYKSSRGLVCAYDRLLSTVKSTNCISHFGTPDPINLIQTK